MSPRVPDAPAGRRGVGRRGRRLVWIGAFLLASCGDEVASPPSGTTPLDVDIQPASAPATARPCRALLVGVPVYADAPGLGARIPPLEGPEHDVRLVDRLLRERFGFPDASIRTLTGEEATLENVVRTFHEHLIEGVDDPDTEVVFWFCGHGSRVPDRSGHEATGFDSSLLLHDSRAADPPRDLDDDALFALLRAIPSRRITVVTDSCHSGDATRGADADAPRVREAAPATRAPEHGSWDFWPLGPIRDDGDPERGAPRWTHVAACPATARAFELRVAGGGTDEGRVPTAHGALTLFLCRRLALAEPGTPWELVVDRVRLDVLDQVQQVVQLQQVGGTATVFDDPLRTRPRGFRARVRPDGRLVVPFAGRLHGLEPGTVCAALDDDSGRAVGSVTIETSSATAATGRWRQAPGREAPEEPVRPRGTSRGVTLETVRLVPDSPADARRTIAVPATDLEAIDAKDAREALAALPWLSFRRAAVDEGTVYHLLAAVPGPGLRLVAPDGFVVWTGDARSERGELALASQREVMFQWLWSLAGTTAGGLAAELEIGPASAAECASENRWRLEPCVPAVVDGDRERGYRITWSAAKGGVPLLRLTVGPASTPAHTVLLDLVASTREVLPVWPGDDGIAASPVERRALMFLPEDGPAEPLHTRGHHRLLAVSSHRQLDLSALRVVTGEARRSLPPGLDELRPGTWGIDGVDVEIRH